MTKSADDALAAFLEKKAEIDIVLDELRALSLDHFRVHPADLTWKHVEVLGQLLEKISEAQRSTVGRLYK